MQNIKALCDVFFWESHERDISVAMAITIELHARNTLSFIQIGQVGEKKMFKQMFVARWTFQRINGFEAVYAVGALCGVTARCIYKTFSSYCKNDTNALVSFIIVDRFYNDRQSYFIILCLFVPHKDFPEIWITSQWKSQMMYVINCRHD